MGDLIQTTFDYGLLDEETRVFVKVATADIQGRLKRTADDIIVIGENLIAVKAKLGHGQFSRWVKSEFDMSQKTSERFMSVAERNKTNPEFVTVTNSKNIGPGRVLYAMAEASDDTIAKVASGNLDPTLDNLRAEKEAEKKRADAAKEAEARAKSDAKAAQQMLLNLTQLSQTEIEDLTKQIEDLKNDLAKNPEIIEQRKNELEEKIRVYEQKLKKLEQEHQKKLDEDLEKQRQDQKIKLKETEKELKASYAQKGQDLQLKAENTIHSLLSHGIKSMAETQLTIEHIVSAGMLQAVQQLGGRQVNSFLAQAESLQEELDRVISNLTQGEYLEIEERASINV